MASAVNLTSEFASSYRNIEDQVRQRTAQLAAANEELKGLDAAKNKFFSNISHEFRTPLTLALAPIDGFLEHSQDCDPKLVESFRNVRLHLQRLLALINDLLFLSKLESAKVPFEPRFMAVVPWLRALVESARSLAEHKGVALSFASPLADDFAIAADAKHLEKVVLNLLGNALKFTPAQGRVGVSLTHQDGRIELAVADSGCGIPQNKLGKIFERFEQAKDDHRSVGTGIGLSLVKEIVELHQGEIAVESEEGKGSTFRVFLPIAPPGKRPQDFPAAEAQEAAAAWPSQSEDRPAAQIGRVAPGGEAKLPPAEGEKAKLLIAEDNPDIRRLLVELLAPHYEIRQAENGKVALAALSEDPPDCLLTDIMMPEMDGLTLVRELRRHEALQSLPVIVLTSRQEMEDKLAAFGQGANDYVGKPFHRQELLARVAAQVQLKKMSERLMQNEKLAALGILSAGICHEIRNPLNNIFSTSLILNRPHTGEEAAAAAASINEEIERADKIIQDLLRFVRAEEEEKEPCHLSALFQSLLSYLASEVRGRIEISAQIPEELRVQGYPSQLKQAFLNLLLNSVQAISGPGKMDIAAAVKGKEVEISIADSGCGIPGDELQRIFEPFYTTKPPGQGTGLGLSLARRLIERSGGRIEMASQVGKGTTARITFPFQQEVPHD